LLGAAPQSSAMDALAIVFGLGTATGGSLAALVADRMRGYSIPFAIDLALACAALAMLLATARQTRRAPEFSLSKAL
jgi:predicted MFS family arabinose efflux permease